MYFGGGRGEWGAWPWEGRWGGDVYLGWWREAQKLLVIFRRMGKQELIFRWKCGGHGKAGLFHAAIADSGGFNGWCTTSLAVAEESFRQLYLNGLRESGAVDKCGVGVEADEPGTQILGRVKSAKPKRCMRDWLLSQPEAKINDWVADSPCFTGCASTLVVDGQMLPSFLLDIVAKGTPGLDFADVPFML